MRTLNWVGSCLALAFLGAGGAGSASGQVWPQEREVVTTRDLATLRDIGGTQPGLAISPSGRWLAYNLRQGDPDRNTYSNRWLLLELATGGSQVLVEDAGPPLLSYGDGLYPWDDYNQGIQAFSPVWSRDEARLLYVRKDSGDIRLHAVELRTGRSAPVPDLPAGKVTGLETDKGVAILTLDIETEAGREAARRRRAEGSLFTGNEFWPARGLPKFVTPSERRILRLDPATDDTVGPGEPLRDACASFPGWPRDQDLTTLYRDCVFDPHGRPVAIGVNLTAPEQGSAVYTITEGRPERVSPEHDWIAAPLEWHSGRFYYVGRDGYSTSDVFEVTADGRARQVTESLYLLGGCVFHFGQDPFAICTAETLTTPRELARIDLQTGRIDVLTGLNPEYIALHRPSTEEFHWTSPNGDVVSGTVTYPLDYDSARAYPVIVTSYPHPGFSRGSNGDEFPIPVFAAQGFLVLDVAAPAYRYWTALDITFEAFVRAYESPLRGLEAYLLKLAEDGIVDLASVGICGLSGGANFTAYAISHSDLFSAAIFGWHETDYLPTITLGTDPIRELHARRGLGMADTANWRAYSLGFRAHQVDAAVLMNVADSEFFFAFGTYDALKRDHNIVEMWVFPDAHHVKWLSAQRLNVYERNVDWFNYWLRDVRGPSLGKADQYARWDELKAMEP